MKEKHQHSPYNSDSHAFNLVNNFSTFILYAGHSPLAQDPRYIKVSTTFEDQPVKSQT